MSMSLQLPLSCITKPAFAESNIECEVTTLFKRRESQRKKCCTTSSTLTLASNFIFISHLVRLCTAFTHLTSQLRHTHEYSSYTLLVELCAIPILALNNYNPYRPSWLPQRHAKMNNVNSNSSSSRLRSHSVSLFVYPILRYEMQCSTKSHF